MEAFHDQISSHSEIDEPSRSYIRNKEIPTFLVSSSLKERSITSKESISLLKSRFFITHIPMVRYGSVMLLPGFNPWSLNL